MTYYVQKHTQKWKNKKTTTTTTTTTMNQWNPGSALHLLDIRPAGFNIDDEDDYCILRKIFLEPDYRDGPLQFRSLPNRWLEYLAAAAAPDNALDEEGELEDDDIDEEEPPNNAPGENDNEDEESEDEMETLPEDTRFEDCRRLHIEAFLIIRRNPRLLKYCFWLGENIGEPFKMFMRGFPETWIYLRRFHAMDHECTKYGFVSALHWALIGGTLGSTIGGDGYIHHKLFLKVASLRSNNQLALANRFDGWLPLHRLVKNEYCNLETLKYFVEHYNASVLMCTEDNNLLGHHYPHHYPLMIALNTKVLGTNNMDDEMLDYLSKQTALRILRYATSIGLILPKKFILSYIARFGTQMQEDYLDSPEYLTYAVYNILHHVLDILFV